FGGDDEAEAEPEAVAAQPEPTNTPPPPPPTATPVPPTPTPIPTPEPVQLQSDTSPVAAPDTVLRTGSSPIAIPIADTEPLINKARQILGEMLQVSVASDQIVLMGLDEQDWPDASLGCPKEGEMYVQMITPGYRMMLEVGGETYEFHTDLNENVVACFDAP
ncbi:MAG: hypothetical protein AAF485_20875, partial [Chloroflexota bacterium]